MTTYWAIVGIGCYLALCGFVWCLVKAADEAVSPEPKTRARVIAFPQRGER